MPFFDASSCAGDLFGWKSEVGTRIQDILARKSIPVTEKLGAIVRKMESAVSTASLKGALSDLMAYLRREGRSSSSRPGDAREALFQRIQEHGRIESIENYGAYIFTVDLRL